jgi:hypothetical protein
MQPPALFHPVVQAKQTKPAGTDPDPSLRHQRLDRQGEAYARRGVEDRAILVVPTP